MHWFKAWRLRRNKRKLALLEADVLVLDAVVRTTTGQANNIYGHRLADTLLKVERLKVYIKDLEE